MKTIYILLISLLITFNLNGESEFKYIQPIAVEEAQVVQMPKAVEVVKEVEPIQEEVVTQETESVEVKQELDSDEDGVVNSIDQCPDTSKYFKVNEVGCPKTATLLINFKYKSYVIQNNYSTNLERFAKFLEENIGYQVIIYGHTDSDGTEENNLLLSKNRAQSVQKALEDYGIDRIRLTSIGKGELEPTSDNETVEGRAQNRRIEIELLQ